MDQLRNDSQRKAESTSAHRVALGQQQELEPEPLEQQLKSNEACGYERGTIGVLSQAIEGARPGGKKQSGASSSPGPTPTEVGGVAVVRVHGGLKVRGCRLGV